LNFDYLFLGSFFYLAKHQASPLLSGVKFEGFGQNKLIVEHN